MLRYCNTCGQQRPAQEFNANRYQVDPAKCASCRQRERQLKIDKGLDIADLMRRWGRAEICE